MTNPSAIPATTTSTAEQLPSDGAPKVKDPLDVRRYQQNPCRMLTAEQLHELNLPIHGDQPQAPLGLACEWMNPETRGDVEIQWGDKNPRGLSGAYAARKADRWAYFVEYPDIEGFPGVAASQSDNRNLGECNVEVGVADQLTFIAFIGLSPANVGKKDPCEVAVQVAGMMVKTMKGGA